MEFCSADEKAHLILHVSNERHLLIVFTAMLSDTSVSETKEYFVTPVISGKVCQESEGARGFHTSTARFPLIIMVAAVVYK